MTIRKRTKLIVSQETGQRSSVIFFLPWTRFSAALVTDSTDAALDMAAGIKNVSGCHPVSVF